MGFVERRQRAQFAITTLYLLAGSACGTFGFDYLASDDAAPNAHDDAAPGIDASIPELGDYALTPAHEGCLDYFQSATGNRCLDLPLRREDAVFAVFEFQMPVLPKSGVRIENVAIDLRIDNSDDDNSTTDQGEVHLIPSFAGNLQAGPPPSNEAILSPELNGFPPEPVPGAGQPSRFSFDAGEYLLGEDRVWIALRTRVRPGHLLIEPASASLHFSVVPGNRPSLPLIDDSRLASEDIRTVFASFSACRNKSVEFSGNECRFGGLKTDTVPDIVVSYLHFTVPETPPGKVLASGKIRMHSTHTGGSNGSPQTLDRVTAFTPTSINVPGSANSPTQLSPLAPASALVTQYAPIEFALNPADLAAGDFYLSISGGTDAVFVYGHNPPAAQLSNRPQLILTYAAAVSP